MVLYQRAKKNGKGAKEKKEKREIRERKKKHKTSRKKNVNENDDKIEDRTYPLTSSSSLIDRLQTYAKGNVLFLHKTYPNRPN